MANPARAYLTTQIETTSQGELLIMLYEAAIKFLKRAKEEIARKDYAKKGIYISKAMAIIHELVESLNKEKGGEITPNLLSLYQFCTSQLVRANIRMDPKRIDDVIRILDGIRSAYAQVVAQEDGKVPAGAPAQPQAPATPQAPPIPPGTMQEQPAYAAPKPVPPTGEQTVKQQEATTAQAASKGSAEPTAPPAKAAAKQAPEQTAAAKKPVKPAPQSPPAPPKLRSAFNVAKFRAANAYNNNS